jgi:hypothetical protein
MCLIFVLKEISSKFLCKFIDISFNLININSYREDSNVCFPIIDTPILYISTLILTSFTILIMDFLLIESVLNFKMKVLPLKLIVILTI